MKRFAMMVVLAAVSSVITPCRADEHVFPGGTTTFIEGGYQAGAVLQTNEFVKGKNNEGKPIDRYQAAFLRFGWQTDGSRDWHHLYNFPAYGLALYGLDYHHDVDLGKPTSLYGFFVWPLRDWGRLRANFDVGFGVATNWEHYDPVNNPDNIAMGLGRSVHLDFGADLEYRLARHWAGEVGFSLTHFSNGGSQAPNSGMNQVGPFLKVKYMFRDWKRPVRRTDFGPFTRTWDLNVTFSGGTRSLNHNVAELDPETDHIIENYFMGNLVIVAGYRTGLRSKWVGGLDVGYNDSVEDLVYLAGLKDGSGQTASSGDRWELGVVAGYEQIVHRAAVQFQLGYMLRYKDVDAALPPFYQRLGMRYYVLGDWHVGLQVRLSDFSRARNLEWGLGRRFAL